VADNLRVREAEETPRLLLYRKSCSGEKALVDHDSRDRNSRDRMEHLMLDVVMIAIALGFFGLSVGYAIACDRL
jgi:hypothetical protein